MMSESSHPYTRKAIDYAKAVIAGDIEVCKYIQIICQTFLTELMLQRRRDFLWRFQITAAEHNCRFIEKLRHIKGEWAKRRETIVLEGWQCFVQCVAYGWVEKETGYRRYRVVYLEVPRKNSKSTMGAANALYLFSADGEEGAEVYSSATSRDQAKIVFKVAHAMATKDVQYQDRFGVEVQTHNMHILKTGSIFEPLHSEGSRLDGLNVSGCINDEFHAHKNRDLHDVIETAMGSRAQAMLWHITTAGTDLSGICYEIRDYCVKILEQTVQDDRVLPIIYTLDIKDLEDTTAILTEEKYWKKANPNYGVSLYPFDIAALAKKARQLPSAQNNFLRKRLNVWCSADTAWMNMVQWQAAEQHDYTRDHFTGQPVIIAYDLASKIDVAAKLLLFEQDDIWYCFLESYLPEQAVRDSKNSQYEGWARAELIKTTPGNIIDYAILEDDLKADGSQFEITEVPYDPFQATQFSTRMAQEGMCMVEVRPTVLNFSEPMKEIEARVLSRRLLHDGNPVLTWMISNVICHYDKKDNIFPNKEKPEKKIDGVVALIMAANRMMAPAEDRGTVYDRRGVISV